MSEDVSNKRKKPKHGKVARGQLALLPEEMGYDTCELDDPRHELFCREYAVHKNGTKAYLKAFPGCKSSTARANSSDLLTKADIVTRIREIRRERMEKLEISHERILQELAKLAFLDPRAFYREDGSLLPISEMDPDAVAALEGVKVKTMEIDDEEGPKRFVHVAEIKHGNKRAALELLMRHREMITDSVTARVTHDGAIGVSDDLEKLNALRGRFAAAGGMNGAARTP